MGTRDGDGRLVEGEHLATTYSAGVTGSVGHDTTAIEVLLFYLKHCDVFYQFLATDGK